MYLLLAYCLVAFTTGTVLLLLWLGWVNHRDQARQEAERRGMREVVQKKLSRMVERSQK